MEKKKKKYNLTIGVILGAVLGLVVGLIFKEKSDNLAFLGNLFMRLIQMPLIALVMCSVMEAVGGLKPAELGKLGGLTIALFAVTSAVGGLFGVILGFVFKPGIGLDMSIFAVTRAMLPRITAASLIRSWAISPIIFLAPCPPATICNA